MVPISSSILDCRLVSPHLASRRQWTASGNVPFLSLLLIEGDIKSEGKQLLQQYQLPVRIL